MLYIIFSQDNPDSLEKRTQVRSAHLARIQILRDENRLVIAGPTPSIDSDDLGAAGFSGSAIIAEFPSLEQAQSWANDDPYAAAGVYQSVVVKPFIRVF